MASPLAEAGGRAGARVTLWLGGPVNLPYFPMRVERVECGQCDNRCLEACPGRRLPADVLICLRRDSRPLFFKKTPAPLPSVPTPS